MTEETWVSGQYMEAREGGPELARGVVYRGLGMRMLLPPASLSGRPVPQWNLTHIATGHTIAYINAPAQHAMVVATAVAISGDWNFTTFEETEETDDLMGRVLGLRDFFGASVLDLGSEDNKADPAMAAEIGGGHVC